MRLYSGTTTQFAEDTFRNQIAEKLRTAFFKHFRFQPGRAEVNSWRNSLRAVSQVFEHSKLDDHGIMLEYQLPLSSKRLDCMVTGHDADDRDSAVIVELKQWDQTEASDGANEVLSWVGGGKREVLHPSIQVGQYRSYLEDTHTAFYEGDSPVQLASCAYLHNYAPQHNDPIYEGKFAEALNSSPLFCADEVDSLSKFLVSRLEKGHGIEVLARVEQSKYRPSKKLMEHVGTVIKGVPEYVLLDEQLVVYDQIFALARKGFHDRQKSVVIVKGGPGTGKSVIAIQIMADLLLEGYNTHYATGSRAFTTTLRKIIGQRGSVQFKYFNSYSGADANAIDVMIADEAHRIRKTSTSRYTPKTERTDKPQIEGLLEVAKVAVFLIDDIQVVRPDEVGSVQHIRDAAETMGCQVHEYELDIQFRCGGSEAFVNWINTTLGIQRTASVLWDASEAFDFQIFHSPDSLESAIRKKADEGHSARVTAGFCWKWSPKPNPDGTLVQDVVIGEYMRPWNARPDATKLAKDIPKANLWAHDPNGLEQVGCVYTAQGFEFDYVGVIFGRDLIYALDSGTWKGDKKASHDRIVKSAGDKFTDLVKNVYRVLLTRGLKGCYVYFVDKETERFFRSRME
ncbi:DNA/RNA helicase domain-containing protein [Candidatus Bipolaricaulota bacterium]